MVEIKSYMNEVIKKLNDGINDRLSDSADVIQDNVKGLTPVKTGKLRESIERSGPSDGSIAVGTDVEYGKYVELGTRFISPRFFMTNGVRKSISKVVNIFSKEIK